MSDLPLYIEQSGSGTPMVFMHGFSFDSRMWQPQLQHFSRQYQALAYDARGFGRSPLPGDEGWSPLDDLDGVLATAGQQRAILVAHSMAAITACDYCYRHPSRIEAMVLVSPSAEAYRWPESFMAQWVAYQELAAIDMEAARTAWLGAELFTRVAADPDVEKQMRAMIDDYSGWHWIHKIPVSTGKLPDGGLQEIRQPVLLVNGDEDSPAFLDCAAQLAKKMPNCRQVLLPRTDHMCNMESVGEFNRQVDDFLQSQALD